MDTCSVMFSIHKRAPERRGFACKYVGVAMADAHRQVLALLIINNNGHMAAGARRLASSNKSLPPDNTELPSAGGRVDQGYTRTQYAKT